MYGMIRMIGVLSFVYNDRMSILYTHQFTQLDYDLTCVCTFLFSFQPVPALVSSSSLLFLQIIACKFNHSNCFIAFIYKYI